MSTENAELGQYISSRVNLAAELVNQVSAAEKSLWLIGRTLDRLDDEACASDFDLTSRESRDARYDLEVAERAVRNLVRIALPHLTRVNRAAE